MDVCQPVALGNTAVGGFKKTLYSMAVQPLQVNWMLENLCAKITSHNSDEVLAFKLVQIVAKLGLQ